MRLGDLRRLIGEVAGDAYKVLGLTSSASPDEIKSAYRKKSLEMHPDRNRGKDTSKEMVKINVAWHLLSDPMKKRRYDSMGDTTMDTMDGSSPSQVRGASSGSSWGRSDQWWNSGSSDFDPIRDAVRRKQQDADRAAQRARSQARQDQEDREWQARRAERNAQASDSWKSAQAKRDKASSGVNDPFNVPPSNDKYRKRYFTYHDNDRNSHKFWWIKLNGADYTYTVGWGRIGTPGQTKTKMGPPGRINSYVSNLIQSKRAKGYVEGTGSGGAAGYEQRGSAPSPKPPTPRPGGPSGRYSPNTKTRYKIYGPDVHTRYKGKAYYAPSDTKFRKGDVGDISMGTDGKIKVSDSTSGHTQDWAGEAFCRLVGDMILEAMEFHVVG